MMFNKPFKISIGIISLVVLASFTFTSANNDKLGQARVNAPELRSWNSTGTFNADGTITQIFRGKWVNYLDDKNNWETINPSFKFNGLEFVMESAPFFAYAPKNSDGEARFVNNNKIDPFDKKKQVNEPILTETLKALDVTSVPGVLETGDLGFGEVQYVIYHNAYPTFNADLIYWVHDGRVPSLEKLVRFNSDPQFKKSTQDFNFLIGFDSPVVFTRSDGSNWGEAADISQKGALKNTIKNGSKRGNSIETLKIWDSTPQSFEDGTVQKVQDIDYKIKSIGKGKSYQLTKIIPKDFFIGATYPVFTDTTTTFYPDDGSTTRDGTLLSSKAVAGCIANARDSTTSAVDVTDAGDYLMYDYVASNNCNVSKWVVMADTSAIPDTDTITAASSGFMWDGDGSSNVSSLSINVYSASTSANTSLATTDFANANFGTTQWATSVTLASAITAGADVYTVFTWNGTGQSAISKTGITKFAYRFTDEVAQTALTTRNYIGNWYLSGHTGTSNDPYLSVTYAPAGASNRHTLIN